MKTRLVVREGKVIELKEGEEISEPKETRFHIGGQSGFKWLKKSANKTWLEGDKIVKDRRGKDIPQ
tara:strand:- start:295 stop:492 length:198 start_codon:yes stop_codon:yes gene_type:complete